MQQKKSIIEEIDFVKNLRGLCQTYEELSVMEMQKIRNSVLATRAFYNGLSTVYYEVKKSYKNDIAVLLKKHGEKEAKRMLIFSKNGKAVSVLVSANTKLYGDIINQTFNYFINNIQKENSDLVIIGRQGKELYESSGRNLPFKYFELPDMKYSLSDIQPIIAHILSYEKINLYYGLFKSLMNQVPQLTNITGDEPFDETEVIDENVKYLFEPSLERTLTFFESHIVGAFFSQLILDSRLARLASRIKAMEESLDRVDLETKLLTQAKRKILRLEDNNRQLTRMSGLSLWR